MEEMRHDICSLRERVAKLEAKDDEKDKALTLARDSVSKTNIGTVATLILAVVAIVIAWLKE
jgi:hypothetical protein